MMMPTIINRKSDGHGPFAGPAGSPRYLWEEKDIVLDKIIGGIAWPGEQPGFAVVIGLEKCNAGQEKIYLLSEIEESDTWRLIQRCVELKGELMASEFYARVDPANMEYLKLWNREQVAMKSGTLQVREAPFSTDGKIDYHINILKNRLKRENKRLFLAKDSGLPGHLQSVSGGKDIAEAKFPAVAALGYAVAVLVVLASRPQSTIVSRRGMGDRAAGLY